MSMRNYYQEFNQSLSQRTEIVYHCPKCGKQQRRKLIPSVLEARALTGYEDYCPSCESEERMGRLLRQNQ